MPPVPSLWAIGLKHSTQDPSEKAHTLCSIHVECGPFVQDTGDPRCSSPMWTGLNLQGLCPVTLL